MLNQMQQRRVVLDTETTGLETEAGHRIIEIGCVEIIGRRVTGRNYHQYINPEREIDAGAVQVHGLDQAFLQDKPKFVDIVEDFLNFISDAELIIHNAVFDIGFIEHELNLLDGFAVDHSRAKISTYCPIVIDTLLLARKQYPGQRNSLDALCKRLQVDASQRELHGALLDAQILSEVYLVMTGGQESLSLQLADDETYQKSHQEEVLVSGQEIVLPVIAPTNDELQSHREIQQRIQETVATDNRIWPEWF